MIQLAAKLLFPAGLLNGLVAIATLNENVLIAIIGLISAVLTVIMGCMIAVMLEHIAKHKDNAVQPELCTANMQRLEQLINDVKEKL